MVIAEPEIDTMLYAMADKRPLSFKFKLVRMRLPSDMTGLLKQK